MEGLGFMARSRVNKRLLVILVGGLILLVGFGWGWWQGTMRQRDPQPYLLEGDKLFDQGEYDKALYQYTQAKVWAAKKGDIETQIMALLKMSQTVSHVDTEQPVGQAMGALEQAVTIDPQSIEAQKARMELQYERVRDAWRHSGWLSAWQDLQKNANDLIDLISSSTKENLDEANARAHYLRGVATLTVINMQRDTTPLEALEVRREALVFFTKACKYQPRSVDYHRALMQTHLNMAAQISTMHLPLTKEDRKLAVESWRRAQNVVKQFREQQPNSGAALVLMTAVLNQVETWSKRDQRDEVAEDSKIGSGLDGWALVDAYLKAWEDDSTRPSSSELSSAADRLREDALQEAEKLGTDVVMVQMAKASYWRQGSKKENLAKVRGSLEKAAEHESDIITKLSIYLQIADTYKKDGQAKKALEICEQALALPVNLRIVRAGALRGTIHLLHHSAAQILVELNAGVEDSDDSGKAANALLDQAEEHVKASLAIRERGESLDYKTLVVRGQIAQRRRPNTPTSNRQAIHWYEQARNEIENMSGVRTKRVARQYAGMLQSLAWAYNFDGQSGAAEESLTNAVEIIRQLTARDQSPLSINPQTMLFLVDLQLQNRHLSEAQKTLDDLVDQLSESPDEYEAEREKWLGEVLKRRARQIELQGDSQKALATAQQVEQQYPDLAEWAVTQQARILRADPDRDTLEFEAVLKRWMALRPDNRAPVGLLIELYMELKQVDKAQALKEEAIVQNPEWDQVLTKIIAFGQITDPAERQRILKAEFQKDSGDSVPKLLNLFRLHRKDYFYYNGIAAKHAQKGETELAEKAREQATQSNELAVQSLEQAYEIQADDPAVHQTLLSYYLREMDWEKAEQIVDRIQEENWDGVGGLYARGRLHNAKGQSLASEDEPAANREYQEALRCLEQTVQKREKFYQAWSEKARAEHYLGQYDAALESARTAVSQNPTDQAGLQLLLVLTFGKWNQAKIAGNSTEAKSFAEETYFVAQRILKIVPNSVLAERFVMAYLDEYDSDKAIEARLALLEKKPTDRDNLRRLLGVYQREKRTAEIRQMLEDLVAKQPDSLELTLVLAEYYNRDKQHDEALRVLQSAQQKWPDRLSVAMALIRTCRLNNEPQQAMAYLQEFLNKTKEEDKGRVYQIMGRLEAQLGRHKEAAKAFGQAIANVKQYHPDDLKTLYVLSQMMFNSGARGEAIAAVLPLAEKDELYAIRLLADFYRRSFETEKSIKWAQRGLSLEPESIDQKVVLAAALLAGNRATETQELLEAELEEIGRGNRAANVYTILAKAYSMQGQYEKAQRILEQAVNSGVNQSRVRYELAILYRFQGKINDAVRQCQLVLEKDPGNRQVRQILANLWIGQGRYAQAEVVLKKGREIDADEGFWPEQLSKLWLNRTDRPTKERAEQALGYAIEASSKSDNNPARVAQVMAIMNLQGQYDRSLSFYENELSKAYQQDYQVLMNLARAEQGKWEQGKSGSRPTMSLQELEQRKRRTLALYLQALDKAQGNWTAYTRVTRAMRSILGLKEAIRSSENLASRNPENKPNRILLAVLLNLRAQQQLAKNQEAQANADMRRAATLLQSLASQTNLNIFMRLTAERHLAEIYNHMGMHTQAVDMYTKVLKVRPDDPVALNNVAYILADTMNKPQEALGYIERALRQDSQEPNLLDTYGWILLKAGRVDLALEKLQQSVSIQPFAVSYYHLGMALKQNKDYRQALQALREAEKLLDRDASPDEQIRTQVKALIKELDPEENEPSAEQP